jgi:cell wall-associated NlpC family hydrolase
MSLRAVGAAMALVVAAGGGVAEARTSVSSGTTTAPAVESVWVNAGVATVWVKPSRTRKVDAPALKAQPDITRWINRQTLRQRQDLGPRVMTQALHGDKLVLVGQRGAWSKVQLPAQTGNKFPDGIVGWIPSRQLSTTPVAHPVLRDGITPHGTGLDVLHTARSYLGVRYLWGGMSKAGLDCSGLTYRVFRSLGVVLPRDAADQSKVGAPVKRRDLRKGDLVFFGTGGWAHIHHVGIYAGNGWVLHAPYTGTTVQLTKLHKWSDYWGARRIR